MIRPWLFGKAKEEDRVEKMERMMTELQQSIISTLAKVQESLTVLQGMVTKQDEKLQAISHDVYNRQVWIKFSDVWRLFFYCIYVWLIFVLSVKSDDKLFLVCVHNTNDLDFTLNYTELVMWKVKNWGQCQNNLNRWQKSGPTLLVFHSLSWFQLHCGDIFVFIWPVNTMI